MISVSSAKNYAAPVTNPLFSYLESLSQNIFVSTLVADSLGQLTYQNFLDLTESYKTFLKDLNLASSDIFSIYSKNSAEYLALLLACFETSTCVAVINDKVTFFEVTSQLAQIKSRHIISTDQPELAGLQTFTFSDVADKYLVQEKSYQPSMWDCNKDACILFTSGSSGQPKAVVHSLSSLFAAASSSNQVTGFSCTKEWLVSLPFSHIAALQIFMRSLLTGARMRILSKHSATDIILALEHKKSDYISVVPTQLEEIITLKGLDFIDQKLDTILLAGAPSSPNLQKLVQELNCQVLTCYGMTEVGSHISCLPRNASKDKRRSVGQKIENVELELRLPDDTEKLSKSLTGQVALKTPQLAKAYIDADGTRTTLGPWFITSDLAEMDPEGFLYIKGRVDSIFISGGENVSLREIEIAALNCQGVKESAVIAVSDPKWGQRPILFVVLDTPEVKEQLAATLNKDLAKFKFPKEIIVLAELPKTSIGKIHYDFLKKLV